MDQPGMERRFQSATERLAHIAVGPTFTYKYYEEPEPFLRFVIPRAISKRIDHENDIRYQPEINGESYLTTPFIAESAIVTRATRVCSFYENDLVKGIGVHSDVPNHHWVFKVEEKRTGDDFSALKNLDDHLAAGKDHMEVDKEVLSTRGASLVEDARPYSMDTVQDETVILARGDVRYCNAAPAPETGYTYALEKELCATVSGKVPGSWCMEVGNNKGPPMVEEWNRASLVHDQPHPTRRRTVFKDFCNTLYSLMDYAEYALAMVQIIQALDHLRLAGYVHQNINPGNCLYTKDSSDVIQIKIADLEYARLYSTESPDTSPLTGTPGFMAVESERRRHLCTPQRKSPPPEPFIYRGGTPTCRVPAVRKKVASPKWFRYNFLHDVESALWMFCWFLFNRLPSSVLGKVSRAQRESMAKVARELFNGTSLDPLSKRRLFIGGFLAYPEAFELLDSIYQQDTQHGLTILNGLEAFESISRLYTEVESSTPIPTAKSFMWSPKEFRPAYYGELQGIFYQMSGLLDDSKLSAVPISFQPVEPRC